MKIKLYFDVRFIHAEQDHEEVEKEGHYVRAYSGDICFAFSRMVSLPCLPTRGQVYHLRFDPPTETTNDDGNDTHYYVRESGFIEQRDKENVLPYFIISDDQSFSEWLEEDPARTGVQPTEQYSQWQAEIEQRMINLTKVFKKLGWEQEDMD